MIVRELDDGWRISSVWECQSGEAKYGASVTKGFYKSGMTYSSWNGYGDTWERAIERAVSERDKHANQIDRYFK